jgi:hypothetical protein
MNRTTEQILVDILKTELALNNNNVYVASQNKGIPNDGGLYIVVSMVDAQIYSNVKETITNGATSIKIVQQLQMRENIQIDIFSSSDLARVRRAEVILALNSYYAERLQEDNDFKIMEVPTSFTNTGSAEGGSEINRFTIIVPCLTWYRKEPTFDYYETFKTRVDDENTIDQVNGVIEFDIPEA